MTSVIRKHVEWEIDGRRFAIFTSGDKIELVAPDGGNIVLAAVEWKVILKELKATLAALPALPAAKLDAPRPRSSHSPWTPELDERLRQRWKEKAGIGVLASEFGRSTLAIQARLAKLGLVTF